MLEDHLSISDAELVLVRLLILEAGSRVLDLSLALADVEVVWDANWAKPDWPITPN